MERRARRRWLGGERHRRRVPRERAFKRQRLLARRGHLLVGTPPRSDLPSQRGVRCACEPQSCEPQSTRLDRHRTPCVL
jgi:hypothetical protein